MALGWRYVEPGSFKLLYHNGGTVGYTSYLAIDPVYNLAVVLLSNSMVPLVQDGDFLIKKLQEKNCRWLINNLYFI